MTAQFVNIHTHRPTGQGIELRTAGIHPWHADTEAVSSLLPLAGDVQAIGETGLDYFRGAPRDKQLEAFRAQLVLAEKAGLPVVLHCVKAFEPVMEELALHKLRAVIFHGFIGSPEQAERAVKQGYYLSFGERSFLSPKTVKAFCDTPLDRIFLETDDTDITIERIYARATVIRSLSMEALKKTIQQNYERIFKN